MTRLNLDTTLRVPPHIVSRVIDDETVLLNLETGIYFGVDQVGQRIWQLVGEGRSLQSIADAIVAEYEVDAPRAETDVLDFARTLLAKGLLAG